MRCLRSFVSLFFVLAVSAAPALQAQSQCDAIPGNLVTNCGFEGATVFSPGQGLAPSGWNAHNWETYNGVDNVSPHSGNSDVSFGNPETDGPALLYQSISDTAGETLDFTFYMENGAAGGAGELFAASFDGSTLLSDDGSADSGSYTEYSYSVVGTGSDTISFSAYNSPNVFFLDDVSVVEVPATPPAVPEPSSIVLLGTGILSLAGAARRKFLKA